MSVVGQFPPAVLRNICRMLLILPHEEDGNRRRHVGSRTVAALAVTARLFLEPAMDVLWYAIPDIAVLFFTLEKEVYSERQIAARGRLVRNHRQLVSLFLYGVLDFANPLRLGKDLVGVLQGSQLERFLAYAQRVRIITSDAHIATRAEDLNAAPGVYDTLAGILGSRPLLPNVEKINYTRSEITLLKVFRSFRILFGPKLWAVRICSYHGPYVGPNAAPITDKDEEAFVQMLKTLADTNPQLQKLYMWTNPNSAAMIASVSRAVCALNHLVSLRLPSMSVLPLTPAAFIHLARLPDLRKLDCVVDGSEDWVNHLAALARSSDSQGTTFPVLHALELTSTQTLALATDLLRFVGSPHLTKLWITANKAVPRHEIDPLLETVAGLRGAKAISQFYVFARRVMPTTAPDAATFSTGRAPRPIGRAALGPLLAMSALDDISLQIRCPYDIDDALLEAFTDAWPSIYRLQLGVSEESWGLPTEGDFPDDDRDPRGNECLRTSQENRRMEYRLNGKKVDRRNVWRQPRATLFGLLALARRRPHVDALQFELTANLSAVPSALLEARPMRGLPMKRKITTLDVGLSPIEDPYAVAALLSDWVAGIEELHHSWVDLMDPGDFGADQGDDDDEMPMTTDWSAIARVYHRRWEKVRRLIPFFAAVRLQERRWKHKVVALPVPRHA